LVEIKIFIYFNITTEKNYFIFEKLKFFKKSGFEEVQKLNSLEDEGPKVIRIS